VQRTNYISTAEDSGFSFVLDRHATHESLNHSDTRRLYGATSWLYVTGVSWR
jgi:hypothetical protein